MLKANLLVMSTEVFQQRVQNHHFATGGDNVFIHAITAHFVQGILDQVRVVAALPQLHVYVAE